MDSYGGNYFNSYQINSTNDTISQYYDPFYVKHRKRTTKAQLKVLEKTFETCPRPDSCMRKKLSDQLSMTPRCVQVWFQNRRVKLKKQQQASVYPNISPNYQVVEQPIYANQHYDLYSMNSLSLREPYLYAYENVPGLHFNEEDTIPVYEHLYDKSLYPYE